MKAPIIIARTAIQAFVLALSATWTAGFELPKAAAATLDIALLPIP